ncbi:hypothetical protein L6164_005072 [Bauhinia variegata]|nr:hypothetical protein L6164_005072 [Bauhinia variegata]
MKQRIAILEKLNVTSSSNHSHCYSTIPSAQQIRFRTGTGSGINTESEREERREKRAPMEKEVVGNLWHGDREAQIQAAMLLSRLSSKQRHKLADKGVIEPLISMLNSQDYEAIEAALCALLSLAFGSER